MHSYFLRKRKKILVGETLRKQLQNGNSSAVSRQSIFLHTNIAVERRLRCVSLRHDGNNEISARYFIRNRPFIRAGRKVWSLTDSQALVLNPAGRRAEPRSFTSCEPLSQRRNVLPREDSYLVFVGTRRSLTSWCTFGSICTQGTYNFLIVSIWVLTRTDFFISFSVARVVWSSDSRAFIYRSTR